MYCEPRDACIWRCIGTKRCTNLSTYSNNQMHAKLLISLVATFNFSFIQCLCTQLFYKNNGLLFRTKEEQPSPGKPTYTWLHGSYKECSFSLNIRTFNYKILSLSKNYDMNILNYFCKIPVKYLSD